MFCFVLSGTVFEAGRGALVYGMAFTRRSKSRSKVMLLKISDLFFGRWRSEHKFAFESFFLDILVATRLHRERSLHRLRLLVHAGFLCETPSGALRINSHRIMREAKGYLSPFGLPSMRNVPWKGSRAPLSAGSGTPPAVETFLFLPWK